MYATGVWLAVACPGAPNLFVGVREPRPRQEKERGPAETAVGLRTEARRENDHQASLLLQGLKELE